MNQRYQVVLYAPRHTAWPFGDHGCVWVGYGDVAFARKALHACYASAPARPGWQFECALTDNIARPVVVVTASDDFWHYSYPEGEPWSDVDASRVRTRAHA